MGNDNEREVEMTMEGKALLYMVLALYYFMESRGPLLPRLASIILFLQSLRLAALLQALWSL
jgi:hypothetical protein